MMHKQRTTLLVLVSTITFFLVSYTPLSNAASSSVAASRGCNVTLHWQSNGADVLNTTVGQSATAVATFNGGGCGYSSVVQGYWQFFNVSQSGHIIKDYCFDIAQGSSTFSVPFNQAGNYRVGLALYENYGNGDCGATNPVILANQKMIDTLNINATASVATTNTYPVISGENACQLGATTARICWKTDVASNTGIRYGVNNPNEQSPPQYSDYTLTNHSYPLTGLQPATRYQYQAISKTSAGASPANGATHYFTTAAVGTNPTPTPTPTTNNSVCARDPDCPFVDQTCVNGTCQFSSGAGNPPPNNQPPGNNSGTTDFSLQPYGPKSFTDLLNVIITWIFNIAIPIAVIMIIWAGLLMLTAGAKPANYEKGKKMLGWAVLGLVVIFIGKGFISLIKSILELGGQ